MPIQTTSSVDTSTQNANWGTLVIVLVLVIAAVVIGTVLYSSNTAHHPAAVVSQTSAH